MGKKRLHHFSAEDNDPDLNGFRLGDLETSNNL